MGLKNRLDLNFVYSRHGKTLLLQVASDHKCDGNLKGCWTW